MWCSWRTVSAPSGASRYQPLIGAEQATSLAGGLDSEIWCFSNFLRLSALKNEPTAQLRQYIQDDRLDSLKVYYIILTILLYSNN